MHLGVLNIQPSTLIFQSVPSKPGYLLVVLHKIKILKILPKVVSGEYRLSDSQMLCSQKKQPPTVNICLRLEFTSWVFFSSDCIAETCHAV